MTYLDYYYQNSIKFVARSKRSVSLTTTAQINWWFCDCHVWPFWLNLLSDSVHDFCEWRFPCVHFDNLYALNDFIHDAHTTIGTFGRKQTKCCRHLAHTNCGEKRTNWQFNKGHHLSIDISDWFCHYTYSEWAQSTKWIPCQWSHNNRFHGTKNNWRRPSPTVPSTNCAKKPSNYWTESHRLTSNWSLDHLVRPPRTILSFAVPTKMIERETNRHKLEFNPYFEQGQSTWGSRLLYPRAKIAY